jgi:hypothetical protein
MRRRELYEYRRTPQRVAPTVSPDDLSAHIADVDPHPTFEATIFGDDWDDLLGPATGINPPGAASDPTRNTTTGLLDFSGTADNVLVGEWQLSHQWTPGTAVRPHLHLRFPVSANANTRWKFEYDVGSVNAAFANDPGVYTTLATITVANPQNVRRHAIAGFGSIPMTGHTESCVILWRLTRLASSDAADTDTNIASLVSIDCHYQKNKAGTDPEYPT